MSGGGVAVLQGGDPAYQGALEAVKMATVFVTVGPILIVYPFAQKYFVTGVMVGSVKG